MVLWVWTLSLALENFTLCMAEGSNYYIVLASISSALLWTLNRVWPLDLDGHSVKLATLTYVLRIAYGRTNGNVQG